MKSFLVPCLALSLLSSSAVMAAPDTNDGVTSYDVKDSDYSTKMSSWSGGKSRLPMLKSEPPRLRNVAKHNNVKHVPGFYGQKSRGSKAYGTYKWPYTTALVEPMKGPKKKDIKNVITSTQPFLAAGKLHMRFGSSAYVCSASLIGKGLAVTAAHCVHEYGKGSSGWATDIYFVPAATSSSNVKKAGPIGRWKVKTFWIPTCYYNGTCRGTSVINSNDVAVLILKSKPNKLPFRKGANYYNYGWNGYGFTTGSTFSSSRSMGQITQLGYPVALSREKGSNRSSKSGRSGGSVMIRTDSVGMYYVPYTYVKNILWGSSQSGGSSGGPELVNFGTDAKHNSGSWAGYDSGRNVVVGVTSWGYVNPYINLIGASMFGQNVEFPLSSYSDGTTNWGAGNIGALMRSACGVGYGGWQAKGYCR